MNDPLIADRGIDHRVVDGAVRPFNAEILLDEIGALTVDSIRKLLGFLFALAASQEAPHFIFSRSIKKHTQCVWAVPEKMLRPPSDDDGVSGFSGVLNDPFRNLQNGFAVKVPMWKSKKSDTPQAADSKLTNLQTNQPTMVTPAFGREHPPKMNNDAMRPLDATANRATGWLGPGMHVKGDITGSEDLLIDGAVEGLIQLEERKLTVGTTAIPQSAV